ncbi:YbaK/EbsC family protein [Bacillus sp. 165]|uniref:YbaK/EbsC family protein n=1 Tax=Bacillus sp. 165 TaxID=1529117 RepID=UPI001ADA45F2|nr:YbaK/EbsC family protein [Bacillus sp. 165]MBO9128962.1 YbaK/EbsC family protein [Bacillus sp. 165]
MSFQRVCNYIKRFDENLEPIQFQEQTNTVEEAARALGIEGAQIAKTILFKSNKRFGLFVTAGDVRVNSKKVKRLLGGGKPKLATPEEVKDITGFQIGGVCPFALHTDVPVFLDESLKRFAVVYTAAGTAQSVLPITFEKLRGITRGEVINARDAE